MPGEIEMKGCSVASSGDETEAKFDPFVNIPKPVKDECIKEYLNYLDNLQVKEMVPLLTIGEMTNDQSIRDHIAGKIIKKVEHFATLYNAFKDVDFFDKDQEELRCYLGSQQKQLEDRLHDLFAQNK